MDAQVLILLICIYNIKAEKSYMEAKVIGDAADIKHYPHSAFILAIRLSGSYICGASILNQRILLTAAHCLEGQFLRGSTVYAGNTDRTLGIKYPIAAVRLHENYDVVSVSHDIGLVLLKKPIKLGKLQQRIAITSWPQSQKIAAVAGWGLIDEQRAQGTHYLHHARLKVWSYKECRKFITTIPKGCICAGSLEGKNYASAGDSGSALIVKDHIQIGVVSFKRPEITTSVAVFTDVAYYYSWIKLHSKRLYCYSDLGLESG